MASDREDRSSEEIRREMESTRTELHETVEALERKLSPGQLLDELWDRVRSGDGGGVGRALKDHPVPLALMGLGVTWLAVESATRSPGDRLRHRHGHVEPGSTAPAEGRIGPYRGEAVARDDATLKDRVAEGASGAVGRVKEKASEAVDAANGGDRAREGFRDVLDDHPLALGAVAFGLGLASGLAAPTTRVEDRLMGHASDALKDEAKDVASEAKEAVSRRPRAEELAAEGMEARGRASASRVKDRATE